VTQWQVKGKSLAGVEHWTVGLICPRHKAKKCGNSDGSYLMCEYCDADLGWYCPASPTKVCIYSEDLDHCDYCGEPSERK
jgi:hypothetical protein